LPSLTVELPYFSTPELTHAGVSDGGVEVAPDDRLRTGYSLPAVPVTDKGFLADIFRKRPVPGYLESKKAKAGIVRFENGPKCRLFRRSKLTCRKPGGSKLRSGMG